MILTDGSIEIAIDGDWGTLHQREVIREDMQSIGGKNYSYHWGSFNAWSIPIDYIPSSDAAQVNEWYRDREELTFHYEGDFILNNPVNGVLDENHLWDSTNVYIMGQPFQQMKKPYQTAWRGNLTIEEI